MLELLEKETLDKAEVAEIFEPRPQAAGRVRRGPARPTARPSQTSRRSMIAAASSRRRQQRLDRNGSDDGRTDGHRRRRRRRPRRPSARASAPPDDRRRRRDRPDRLAARATGDESPPFDHDRAEAAVRELLIAIGEDPDRDGPAGHPGPGRPGVRRAVRRAAAGAAEDVLTTTFDVGHDEMVLVRDIELWSMCEHHLVPFTGVAHVGYIPSEDGRITGLSKLARLVDVYARRPQVQERLTTQVADALMRDPRAARRRSWSSRPSTCA